MVQDLSGKKNYITEPELFFLVGKRLTSLSPDEVFIVAIDGKCASGKTTLASHLKEHFSDKARGFSAELIHMDDFFLPLSLRTEKRLNEPGGNVHYERFFEEVFLPLKRIREGIGLTPETGGSSISYRRFNCSLMDYEQEPTVLPFSRLYIVEGAYCMRPEFSGLYDLKIYSDINDELQREHIISRNGTERFKIFRDRWIPMENRYLDFYDIEKKADFIFDSSFDNRQKGV